VAAAVDAADTAAVAAVVADVAVVAAAAVAAAAAAVADAKSGSHSGACCVSAVFGWADSGRLSVSCMIGGGSSRRGVLAPTRDGWLRLLAFFLRAALRFMQKDRKFLRGTAILAVNHGLDARATIEFSTFQSFLAVAQLY
jgi:hypothetical protein